MFPRKQCACSIPPSSPRSGREANRYTKAPWQRIAWIVLLAIVVPSMAFAYKKTFRWVGDWETLDHTSALKIYSVNPQYIRFEINASSGASGSGTINSGTMLGSAHFNARGSAIYRYPDDAT